MTPSRLHRLHGVRAAPALRPIAPCSAHAQSGQVSMLPLLRPHTCALIGFGVLASAAGCSSESTTDSSRPGAGGSAGTSSAAKGGSAGSLPASGGTSGSGTDGGKGPMSGRGGVGTAGLGTSGAPSSGGASAAGSGAGGVAVAGTGAQGGS